MVIRLIYYIGLSFKKMMYGDSSMLKGIGMFCITQFLALLLTLILCFTAGVEAGIGEGYEGLEVLNMATGEIAPLNEIDIDPADVKLVTINFHNLDDIDITLFKTWSNSAHQSEKMYDTNYSVSGGFGLGSEADIGDGGYKGLKVLNMLTGEISPLEDMNIDTDDVKVASISLQDLQDIDLSPFEPDNKGVQQVELIADSLSFFVGAGLGGAVTAIVTTPLTIIAALSGGAIGGASGAIVGGVAGAISGIPASGIGGSYPAIRMASNDQLGSGLPRNRSCPTVTRRRGNPVGASRQ